MPSGAAKCARATLTRATSCPKLVVGGGSPGMSAHSWVLKSCLSYRLLAGNLGGSKKLEGAGYPWSPSS